MANLPALLGSEASRALTQSLTKTATPIVTQALTPATTNIITQAATPEVAASLSQLLPSRSGSAIDGVINRSTGITLPNAPAKTFKDYTGSADLASAMAEGNMDVSDLNALLPSKQANALRSGVAGTVTTYSPASTGALGTATTKSSLPKIRTSDYYKATGLKGKDVPSYMKNYLSEKGGLSLDDGAAWGEVFPEMAQQGGAGSFTGTADDILARYEQAAGTNAKEIYTPENYVNHLLLNPEQNTEYTNSLTNLLGGETTQIPVGQTPTQAQTIPVSGVTITETQTPAKTVAADATKAAGTAPSVSPITSANFGEAQQNVAEQFGLSGAGQGGGGGITITPSSSPEDAGFNVPLKTEDQKTIKINAAAAKTTAAQKNARFKDDNWLKGVNATAKQYAAAVKKSNSFGGYYKTPAARAQANNLTAANLGDRVQAMLDVRQNGVSQAEQYATEQGVRVNLPAIELTQPQAQSLATNGVDINTIVRDGTATPLEAEQIYKTLRDDGYRLSNATDGTSLEKSRAYSEMAKKVSSALNETMDALNIDYKTALLQDAANIGEDSRYLAEIAKAPDFKFSDLRSDMADLMTLKDLASNKLKNAKNINIAGIDTGIPNPATSLGEKLRGAYYNAAERLENVRAGAGAAGGAGGAGTTAGDYTFIGGDGSASGLANLLGGAKKVAPYALAAGIGFMAGGAGGQGASGNVGADMTTLMSQGAVGAGGSQANANPYETATIGGYNYQQLEDGYFRALMAGDTGAANQIAKLIDVLQTRISNEQKNASSSSSSSSMSQGLNILNQLYGLYQQMGGSQGIVGGNVTNALNTISGGAYNSDVATYNQTRALTSSMLARALGEKGTLSDADRKYINDNLPKVTDDPTVAEKKFKAIYSMLQTAASS